MAAKRIAKQAVSDAERYSRSGIEFRSFCGGCRRIYVGTREAMIAAGLLTLEQIPGGPGCPRTSVFSFVLDDRPHKVSVSPKRGLVRLMVEGTSAEWETYDARCDALQKARDVAKEVRRQIELLPRSREAYCELARVLASVRSCRDVLLRPIGGYSITEAAWNEFEQTVDMACDDLLEHVTFSRAARDRQIEAYRQQAAEADPEFARFMKAISAGENA